MSKPVGLPPVNTTTTTTTTTTAKTPSEQSSTFKFTIKFRKKGFFSSYSTKYCVVEHGKVLKIYNSEKDYLKKTSKGYEKIVLRNCRFKVKPESGHSYCIKVYDIGTTYFLSFSNANDYKEILLILRSAQTGSINSKINNINQRNDVGTPVGQNASKVGNGVELNQSNSDGGRYTHVKAKTITLDNVKKSSLVIGSGKGGNDDGNNNGGSGGGSGLSEVQLNMRYRKVLRNLGVKDEQIDMMIKTTPATQKQKIISAAKLHGNDDDKKDGDSDDVTFWISKFRNPLTVTTENLEDLSVLLYNNTNKWCIEFINEQGLVLLTKIIPIMIKNDDKPSCIELLKCFKVIIDKRDKDIQIGLDYFTQYKMAIQGICDMFDGNDFQIRLLVIKLLTVICWYSTDGFNKVFSSMNTYKENTSKQDFNKSIFSPIIIPLNSMINDLRMENNIVKNIDKHSTTFEFCLYSIGFINAILNSFDDIETRVKYRTELDILHFDTNVLNYLLTLFSNKDIENNKMINKLEEQLKLYKDFKFNDIKDITFLGINVTSPKDLFAYIDKNCIPDGYLNELTHILQCFIAIPSNKSYLWKNMEEIINIATQPQRLQLLIDYSKDTDNDNDDSKIDTERIKKRIQLLNSNDNKDKFPSVDELRVLIKKHKNYEQSIIDKNNEYKDEIRILNTQLDNNKIQLEKKIKKFEEKSKELMSIKKMNKELELNNSVLNEKNISLQKQISNLLNNNTQQIGSIKNDKNQSNKMNYLNKALSAKLGGLPVPSASDDEDVDNIKLSPSKQGLPKIGNSGLPKLDVNDNNNNSGGLPKLNENNGNNSGLPPPTTVNISKTSSKKSNSSKKKSNKKDKMNFLNNALSAKLGGGGLPKPAPVAADIPTNAAPLPDGITAAPIPGGSSNAAAPPPPLPPPLGDDQKNDDTKEEQKECPEHLQKFLKMKKMNLPLIAIKNAMIRAGLKFEELEPFLGIKKQEPKQEPPKEIPEHLQKFMKMKKMNLPIVAIKNAMIRAGVDFKELEPFLGIGDNGKKGGGVGLPPPIVKPKLPPGMKEKKKYKPKGQMKQLHWTKVKPTEVKGTIWEKMEDEKLDLDFKEFEQLFAKKQRKKKTSKKKNGATSPKKSKKEIFEEITLIDYKRSYNVNIGLARFKMKHLDIKDAILRMDENILNPDKIAKLCNYVPTSSEQDLLRNFDGNHQHLANTEKFFFVLSNITNLQKRMELWLFKVNFGEQISNVNEKVNLVEKCHDTVKDSKSLKRIFEYVLVFGNYMNSGTKKDQCYGFKLGSLKQLTSAKTVDNSMTLLAYLIKVIESKEPEIIQQFINEMEILTRCASMDYNQLQSDINIISGKLNQIKSLIESDKPNDMSDQFNIKMKKFYHDNINNCNDLKNRFDNIQNKLKILGNYFGSNNDTQFEYLKMIDEFKKKFKDEYDKLNRIKANKEKEERKRLAKEAREKSLKLKKKRGSLKTKLSATTSNSISKRKSHTPTVIGSKLNKHGFGSQSVQTNISAKRNSSGSILKKSTNNNSNKKQYNRKNTENDDSDDDGENLTDNLIFGSLMKKSQQRGLPPINF